MTLRLGLTRVNYPPRGTTFPIPLEDRIANVIAYHGASGQVIKDLKAEAGGRPFTEVTQGLCMLN